MAKYVISCFATQYTYPAATLPGRTHVFFSFLKQNPYESGMPAGGAEEQNLQYVLFLT